MRFRSAFKTVTFFILMIFFCNAEAKFDYQGHGIVGMTGSIIDSACSIAVNNENQSIIFGPETTGELIHDGHGRPVSFAIHLIGCNLNAKNESNHRETTFSVTFDGQLDGRLFAVSGASGFGILIFDKAGDIIRPGTPLPAQKLKPGEQMLEYALELYDDRHRFIAGNWHTTIRFKVDYN